MIKSLVFLVALLGPSENVLIIPDNSPFTIQEAGLEYGSPTRFSGELQLEGKYQFEWAVIDGKLEWLELRIIPNESRLRLIPFAEDKPVVELWVRNADAVARAILAESEVDKLLKRELLVITGIAAFRVGALETAVDCDNRSYVVDVIEAEPAQLLAGSISFPPRVGC